MVLVSYLICISIIALIFLITYLILKQLAKKKIIVCLFGIIPRSIRYTWNNIKERIINPLKSQYNVTIYIFNLKVDADFLIDNKRINNQDLYKIKYDYLEEYEQKSVDKDIENKCNKCKFIDHDNKTTLNALRQLYSEYRVGKYLEKNIHNYDGCVISGPDYYFSNYINLRHINSSLKKHDTIYLSKVNDENGYTNGFYFGTLKPMCKILKRYEDSFEVLKNQNIFNYETLLKYFVIKYGINIERTDINFLKVRNNGSTNKIKRFFDKQNTF